MTRDSWVLRLTLIGSIFGYLIADGRPPTEWSYNDWLKAGLFLTGLVSGKLASSPLKHSEDL